MRKILQNALLIAALAAVAFAQHQDRPGIAPANPNLVPREFTIDDGPVSISVPFQVLVNGKEFQGHTIGWHIDTGSTLWLGLPGQGMYILSLAPREGYNFQKAGAIRNHVIAFQSGGNQYEIRTSGPIAGAEKAWNLYVLHLPEREMKGPLFGVDRLGSCTLAHVM
jgi:hypothetical protein